MQNLLLLLSATPYQFPTNSTYLNSSSMCLNPKIYHHQMLVLQLLYQNQKLNQRQSQSVMLIQFQSDQLGRIDLPDRFHSTHISLIHLYFQDLNIRLNLVKSIYIIQANSNVRIPNKAEFRLDYPIATPISSLLLHLILYHKLP